MSLMPNLNTVTSPVGAAPGARPTTPLAAARGGGFAQMLGQAQRAAEPLPAVQASEAAESSHEASEHESTAAGTRPTGTSPDAGATASSAPMVGPPPRAPTSATRAAATNPLRPAAATSADDLLAQAMPGRTTDAAEDSPLVAAPCIAAEAVFMPVVGRVLPVAGGPDLAGPGAPTDASAAPSVPAAEGTLASQPGSSAFATELSAQLTTYVRQGVQHARLQLNPADLGPVDVRIQVDGDAARVVLTAEQAPTRQWLEQALPSLAGSLREAGLTLAGGGVFERGAGSGANSGQQPPAGRDDGLERDPELTAPPSLPLSGRRRGVVDLVA
jgi:flagellar hook-length control protein FliK